MYVSVCVVHDVYRIPIGSIAPQQHTNNIHTEWDGGLVLVSHDFRLISQVANEIWVVADGTVKRWEGDIQDYKAFLKGELKTKGDMFTKTK